MMLSFGESKRDTRGVVAMATEAMATDSPSSSSSSSSLYSSCTTNALGGVFLGEVALVGERLGLVLSDELATIVFPLLIRALRNKVTYIATTETSPHSLLALCAT